MLSTREAAGWLLGDWRRGQEEIVSEEDAFDLTVPRGIDAQTRGRNAGECSDGHEARGSGLRTKHAKRLDLSAIRDAVGSAPIGVVGTEVHGTGLQDPRLALDPRDGAIAVVDGEVISQPSGQRAKDFLAASRQRRGDFELASITERRRVPQVREPQLLKMSAAT
jgi:hypothetical protein